MTSRRNTGLTTNRAPASITALRRLGVEHGAGAEHRQGVPGDGARPPFMKDVRGPLPQVKLMPTGGVTLDNAGDWIRAGAVAVGVGTALLDAKAIAAGASTSCGECASASSRASRPHGSGT